jgi:hypothetical protein
MRDEEGWKGFKSVLHINTSNVEFPTSLAADCGIDEADCQDSLDALADSGPSTADPAPARMAFRESRPSPGDSPFGDLRHVDLIFREKLEASLGRPGEIAGEGEVRFVRLDPRAFAQGSGVGDAGLEDAVVDPRAGQWVGLLGERFACLQLQRAYPESFDPTRHWVSSGRLKFYPWARAGVNDTLGYDMEVQDTRALFVANRDFGSGKHRRCFVEVKSTAGAFRGVFHLSRNELRSRERCAEMNARHEPSPHACLGRAAPCPPPHCCPELERRSITISPSLLT